MRGRFSPMFTIHNKPQGYAWGMTDGISHALGWPVNGNPEAELWLGAHHGSPCRIIGGEPWPDLATWEAETGQQLPFLLKVLAAGRPLSLQAHPSAEQAAAGFADEERRGVNLNAGHRNYRDPHPKPEMLVALSERFEALVGFRPLADVLRDVDHLRELTGSDTLAEWSQRLRSPGVRDTVAWLLSGGPGVARLPQMVATHAAALQAREHVTAVLAEHYPGDPGIAVALMLNHVILERGEALWVPAGVIHSYLSGVGIELMAPSDNVLRGGLTPKHVDVPELLQVLDCTDGPPTRLAPTTPTPNVRLYAPSSTSGGQGIDFTLSEVTGNASMDLTGPSILLVVDGSFMISREGGSCRADRGEALFLPDPGPLHLSGVGTAFVAS